MGFMVEQVAVMKHLSALGMELSFDNYTLSTAYSHLKLLKMLTQMFGHWLWKQYQRYRLYNWIKQRNIRLCSKIKYLETMFQINQLQSH